MAESESQSSSIQSIEVELEAEIITPLKQPHVEEEVEQESDEEGEEYEGVYEDMSFTESQSVSSTQKKTQPKFSITDRITKRVLAPYLKVIRKSKKILEDVEEENAQFQYYLTKKPLCLMRDLSKYLDSRDTITTLFETSDVLKETVRAAGVTLYIVDEVAGEICQCPRNVLNERHRVTWKIEQGKTVAAYVASTKDYVIADEVLGDLRFLDGAAYQDETIKSVLCVPIVNPDNVCIAILELYRDVYQPNFTNDDLKIAVVITSWVGTALYENEKRLDLQKQQELNTYLLDLILCYFAQSVPIEKLISEVVMFAKDTLGTERGSFYIVYQERDGFEADVFEEGVDGTGKLHKKNLRVTLEPNSILGVVARTLEPLNIRDAYADPRYDSEADLKFGLITRSLLCVPITSVKGVLGLIQLTNKKKSVCFSSSDEDLLKTFSLYSALALQYFNRRKSSFEMEKFNECFMELIKYHTQPCCHDLQYYTEKPVVELPQDFDELSWHISSDLYPNMPQFLMSMMLRIVGSEEVEINAMMQFILSARKVYQVNHYHAFEHTFTVCHSMFVILLRNQAAFSNIELKALMITALCHDLDHKGLSNKFLYASNNILAQLYEESYLENHHYQMTLMLLQDSKIFKTMTCCMFQEILFEIKQLILATELAVHFDYRKKLSELLEKTRFDWHNSGHRKLLKNILITMCDISGQCKPYSYAKKNLELLYKEFYHEGDLSKKMGLVPLSLMDRDKSHLVPEDQVQFLTVVVIPCAELVTKLLPNVESLLTESKKNRDLWLEIIELRGEKCWKPGDSITID